MYLYNFLHTESIEPGYTNFRGQGQRFGQELREGPSRGVSVTKTVCRAPHSASVMVSVCVGLHTVLITDRWMMTALHFYIIIIITMKIVQKVHSKTRKKRQYEHTQTKIKENHKNVYNITTYTQMHYKITNVTVQKNNSLLFSLPVARLLN